MSLPVPAPRVPIVDPTTGILTDAWFLYLASLSARPPGFAPVVVGLSPFSYTASGPGSVAVVGGTVSAITIDRGTGSLATGATSGIFPVAQGDIITVTYTVLPTITFIPA